jgi:hypothetical protein
LKLYVQTAFDTELPNIADIIAGQSNQDKTLQESAAGLGAMILEMEREGERHGKHSRRLAKLKELADIQFVTSMTALMDFGGRKKAGWDRSH